MSKPRIARLLVKKEPEALPPIRGGWKHVSQTFAGDCNICGTIPRRWIFVLEMTYGKTHTHVIRLCDDHQKMLKAVLPSPVIVPDNDN